jgi:hypothetical protein
MLRARLPDDFAELLVPVEGSAPVHAGHGQRARQGTLATGRPGSSHPISEASADRTQRESIAASENPHADTKLSSTPGVSSVRSGRSLASGKPGFEHTIAEDD